MDNCLNSVIRKAAAENNTDSLKKFISSECKENLNITEETLFSLQSIICNNNNKLDGVRVVLSCLKLFYEQTLDKNVWDKLAEKFAQLCLTCLHESIKFFETFFEDVSIFDDISEIISKLVTRSEHIVYFFHYLVVQPIITIIINTKFSYHMKYSLAKAVCSIARHSGVNNHSKINPLLHKVIADFANWIFVCGNYEIQTIILETLLYFLSGINDVNQFCASWFDLLPQVNKYFLNQDFTKEFDTEARIFLNMINRLNKNTLVFSIDCIHVFLDGVKLEKPNDNNYLGFWIDFNVGSESVQIYHQGGSEMWEVIELDKINIKEVCSSSSECNVNNKIKPVVKLYFTLIGFDKSTVEIWFEIFEQFQNLEKSFLIPVYATRYQCNLKSSISNSILPNEVLNLEYPCAKKYTPLSVVITPTKFCSMKGSSQAVERSQLDVSIHDQSTHNKELQSNIIFQHSDDSSCDEVMCTPENILPKKKSKLKLIKSQCKSFSASCKDNSFSETTPKNISEKKHKHKVIINKTNVHLPVETRNKKVKNKKGKINKVQKSALDPKINEDINKSGLNIQGNNENETIKSNLYSSKKSEKRFRKNNAKSNCDSIKRKKLFYPSDNEELNSSSPFYDSSQKHEQSAADKVTYSYRRFKEAAVQSPKASHFENEFEFLSPDSQCSNLTINDKKNVYSPGKNKFFKHKDVDLTETLNKIHTNKIKSVYSDFSSTSSETMRSVKKSYAKQKNINKRKTKSKPTKKRVSKSFFGNSLSKGKMSQKLGTKNTYVSKLDTTELDPLRFKHNDNDSKYEVTSIFEKSVQKPKVIGESVLTNCEAMDLNLTPLTIQDNKLPDKDFFVSPEQENICNKKTDLDMETYSSKKKSVLKKSKKTCIKEDIVNKQSILFKNLWKKIEDADKNFKTERRNVYSKFLSHVAVHEKNISLVESQLDKCKMALEKSNKQFQNGKKCFAESILEMETKHTKLLEKHVKEMKAEVKFFLKDCQEVDN